MVCPRNLELALRPAAPEGHCLDELAIEIARLQLQLSALGQQIIDRLFLSGRAGEPPTEIVGREHSYVLQESVWFKVRRCGDRQQRGDSIGNHVHVAVGAEA